MIKDIRGQKVRFSKYNCFHETIEELRCDICKKKVENVYVLQSIDGKKTYFVGLMCSKENCFKQAWDQLSFTYPDDDYFMMCGIKDILFKTRPEAKKRIRSEMTLKKRYEIMKRDNFRCVLCGRRPPEVFLVIDHIIPVKGGGDNSKDNLRTTCFECNSGKGTDYDK